MKKINAIKTLDVKSRLTAKQKKTIIILTFIALIAVIIYLIHVLNHINKIEIYQYTVNENIVYNYNGNEYYLRCEENKDKFSTDLYENFHEYIPDDVNELDENTKLKGYIVNGNLFSYFHPYSARVIYDGDDPIMIEQDNYIIGSDYYLIVEQ